MVTKTCMYCGKEFQASHGGQGFCSEECRRFLREDTADGDEFASELFVKWESIQYGLDDLRDYFRFKLYEADDTD